MEKMGDYVWEEMNISDHSQTLCLMVADLYYVAAKSFLPEVKEQVALAVTPRLAPRI